MQNETFVLGNPIPFPKKKFFSLTSSRLISEKDNKKNRKEKKTFYRSTSDSLSSRYYINSVQRSESDKKNVFFCGCTFTCLH